MPRQPFELKRAKAGIDKATQVEMESHEMPGRDSYDEQDENDLNNYSHAENTDEEIEVVVEQEEEEEGSPLFEPSIKIKRMDGTLLISTIVLKEVALTSALFNLLEEEKLDIVYEHQYRTETRVAHTIQVNVETGYNIDELERKLHTWAGKIK